MNLQPYNSTEALIASRDAAFARVQYAIINSEELIADIDAALLRCERRIALAQIRLDEINDSVSCDPKQLEFEARIRARCSCRTCSEYRSNNIAHGYKCACDMVRGQCDNAVGAEGGLCGYCVQGDHSGHF